MAGSYLLIAQKQEQEGGVGFSGRGENGLGTALTDEGYLRIREHAPKNEDVIDGPG
jgi:hypothetical protein